MKLVVFATILSMIKAANQIDCQDFPLADNVQINDFKGNWFAQSQYTLQEEKRSTKKMFDKYY